MTVARALFELDDSYARAVPGLTVPWTAAPAPEPAPLPPLILWPMLALCLLTGITHVGARLAPGLALVAPPALIFGIEPAGSFGRPPLD